MIFEFDSSLWHVDEPGGWYFYTLPEAVSSEVHHLFKEKSLAFGSLSVMVTIHGITWTTSLFYDTARQAYLLPVKKAIRKKAQLALGQSVPIEVRVDGCLSLTDS